MKISLAVVAVAGQQQSISLHVSTRSFVSFGQSKILLCIRDNLSLPVFAIVADQCSSVL